LLILGLLASSAANYMAGPSLIAKVGGALLPLLVMIGAEVISASEVESVVDDTFRRLVHEWPTPIGPKLPAPRARKADDAASEPKAGREPLHSVPVPIDRAQQSDPFEAARAYYEAETAAGRQPTGPELAQVTGQSRRTGARYLARLTEQSEEVAVR
jgi:hypothetical protein